MYFHLLTFLTLAILFHHSHAQNSDDQEFLDAHNAARALVGVGPMTWDAKVAAYALNHTNSRLEDCKSIHSINSPYGENLAKGVRAYSGPAAVNKLWVYEKRIYNYTTNKRLPGTDCGHYTQVVWKTSVRLGCAWAQCRNSDRFITACSYDPRGNWKGQKPY